LAYATGSTTAETAILKGLLRFGGTYAFDKDLTAPAGSGDYVVWSATIDLTAFSLLYIDAEGKDAVSKLNFKIGGVELTSFAARAIKEVDVSSYTGNQDITFEMEQSAGGENDCYIYHFFGY
jgi:hypothetical protein